MPGEKMQMAAVDAVASLPLRLPYLPHPPAEAHAVSAGKDELWRSLFAAAFASIAAAAPVEVFHAAA